MKKQMKEYFNCKTTSFRFDATACEGGYDTWSETSILKPRWMLALEAVFICRRKLAHNSRDEFQTHKLNFMFQFGS